MGKALNIYAEYGQKVPDEPLTGYDSSRQRYLPPLHLKEKLRVGCGRLFHTQIRLLYRNWIALAVFSVSLWACGVRGEEISSGQDFDSPNVVLIYADDLGYGDVGCYGAVGVSTPNIDGLAAQGILFTDAYASASTCTPSRFTLMTGRYAFRVPGTGVAPGDASLLIDTTATTLPGIFKQGGYTTAMIGKWHLGLGGPEGPDWNGEIRPGPRELGFDYSFIIPATNDRVPCVYVENHRVVNLDLADPIAVSYGDKTGDWPTGRENPELLRMRASHGHDQTIVNGIGRIGYMTGGRSALWRDEDIADVLVQKSLEFIGQNRERPFFLFFSAVDIHAPRIAHERFAGASSMGPRGDMIVQLDWSVGEIVAALERHGLIGKTIILFSSDNGPVTDDGYEDRSDELLGDHDPAGGLRGGKYSAFEAGTRVPMILQWKGRVRERWRSDALISQADFLRSFAAMIGVPVTKGQAPDSQNVLEAMLGMSEEGRGGLVQQAISGVLSYREGHWKYIVPHDGPKIVPWGVNNETGFSPEPQLYNLKSDPAEQRNLASGNPRKVAAMAGRLRAIAEPDTAAE
jgi:arylsulfatase A-like enzyme